MKNFFKRVGHVERTGYENLTGNERRCPESGGEIEARKTEIAMGGLYEETQGKSGRGKGKDKRERTRAKMEGLGYC